MCKIQKNFVTFNPCFNSKNDCQDFLSGAPDTKSWLRHCLRMRYVFDDCDVYRFVFQLLVSSHIMACVMRHRKLSHLEDWANALEWWRSPSLRPSLLDLLSEFELISGGMVEALYLLWRMSQCTWVLKVSVLEAGHTRYCSISGSDPLRQSSSLTCHVVNSQQPPTLTLEIPRGGHFDPLSFFFVFSPKTLEFFRKKIR